MKTGVALFQDGVKPGSASGTYCAHSGTVSHFSSIAELPDNFSWFTNLGYDEAGALRGERRLRDANYFRVSYEQMVRDLGARAVDIPKSKATESDGLQALRCERLFDALEMVHEASLCFGLPEAPRFSLAHGYRQELASSAPDESLARGLTKVLAPFHRGYVKGVPGWGDGKQIYMSLSLARVDHGATLLQMPKPIGPFRRVDVVDLPSSPSEFVALERPTLACCDLSRLPEPYRHLFGGEIDIAEVWLTPYELAAIDGWGSVRVLGGIAGETYEEPAVALPALPPIASASWAVGIVMDAVVSALGRGATGKSSPLTPFSFFLTGLDRAECLVAAGDLLRRMPQAGLVGYGSGRLDVRLPASDHPLDALIRAVRGSSLMPPAVNPDLHPNGPAVPSPVKNSPTSVYQTACLMGDVQTLREIDRRALAKMKERDTSIAVGEAGLVDGPESAGFAPD